MVQQNLQYRVAATESKTRWMVSFDIVLSSSLLKSGIIFSTAQLSTVLISILHCRIAHADKILRPKAFLNFYFIFVPSVSAEAPVLPSLGEERLAKTDVIKTTSVVKHEKHLPKLSLL